MPIVDPDMSDLATNQIYKQFPKVRSLLFSSQSQVDASRALRFPLPGTSINIESLEDRIARAQLVAALKQSLRSTRAAKDLIFAQLSEVHCSNSGYGLPEADIVLLKTCEYLDNNIINLETLLSACGADISNDEYLCCMKITICELRNVIRKIVEASYEEDLDNVMNGFKLSLDGLEDAHPQAPDEESKAIVAGLHSDLFNAKAQARPFLMKLKSKLKASKGSTTKS